MLEMSQREPLVSQAWALRPSLTLPPHPAQLAVLQYYQEEIANPHQHVPPNPDAPLPSLLPGAGPRQAGAAALARCQEGR